MKRKLVVLLGFVCLLFAVSACEPDVKIDSVYGCGLHTWKSSSLTDLATVENYIKSNGGPYGSVIIRAGKSEKENDATIKAQFDAAVAKMDFSTLKLDAGTSFVYSVVGSTSTPGEEGRVVASVKWPK